MLKKPSLRSSIDKSILQQLVIFSMVSAQLAEEITDKDLEICIDKEADVTVEEYDLVEIEKDIETVRMPKRGFSLQNRVRMLSLHYGRRLTAMGYSSFIVNCPGLAIKHILHRIDHDQLHDQTKTMLRLHKTKMKDIFNLFVQSLFKEAEYIDRVDMVKRTSHFADSDSD